MMCMCRQPVVDTSIQAPVYATSSSNATATASNVGVPEADAVVPMASIFDAGV